MTSSKRLSWLFIALSIAYAVAYGILLAQVPITATHDSSDYLKVAGLPLFSREFWTANKVFGVPLIYKLCGLNSERIAAVQSIATIASWIALAWALAIALRKPGLKICGTLLILLFSLNRDLYFWPRLLLTEAISMAAFNFMMAQWIWFFSSKKEKPWFFAAINLLTMLFWGWTRDTNAYFLFGTAMILFASTLLWRTALRPYRLQIFAVSGILILNFFIQGHVAGIGGRRQIAIVEIIAQRILPDAEATRFFAEHGMPMNEKVLRYRGQWSSSFENDWSGFGDWLNTDAEKTLKLYLLSSPFKNMWIVIRRWQDFFSTTVAGYNPSDFNLWQKGSPLWQKAIGYTLNPKSYRFLALALAAFVFAARARKKHKTWDARFLVPGILIALVYPMLFLNWHGEPMEVVRHVLGTVTQAKLGFWLLFFFAVDHLLSESEQTGRVR